MRSPKRALNPGANIEGGDRFLLGDCWLRFMGVIGMSDETVGNVFDGSGGLGGKPRKSIISGNQRGNNTNLHNKARY